jgi:hypothetical protein
MRQRTISVTTLSPRRSAAHAPLERASTVKKSWQVAIRRSDETLRVSTAVTLGVTGIVVSGIVGPALAAWFSGRGEQQRFAREQLQRRREDLRVLVDEGAVLLGAGETNLRLAHEAVARRDPEPAEVKEWGGAVHLLGQRLLLRLSRDDEVVVAYEAVRDALLRVGEAYGDERRYPAAVAAFEERRAAFLDKAREALARIDPR